MEFFDAPLLDVLKKVRDFVHLGHGLVTHPMAGGLPPGTMPYKSVIVTDAPASAPSPQFVSIIEAAITANTDARTRFYENHFDDYAKLDLALMQKGGM